MNISTSTSVYPSMLYNPKMVDLKPMTFTRPNLVSKTKYKHVIEYVESMYFFYLTFERL